MTPPEDELLFSNVYLFVIFDFIFRLPLSHEKLGLHFISSQNETRDFFVDIHHEVRFILFRYRDSIFIILFLDFTFRVFVDGRYSFFKR